ncbi:hypothetical protein C4D60_Mb01t08660 [Musa balbisiana]|uniref:Uncharacterized protein n=1 Tax=Musa balbisiana TaxID=52838 RepID=A0A4S8JN90_MUSBA|nr:hypothetical protein C4D60_Mb01t08660 [Musa balbisiana]
MPAAARGHTLALGSASGFSEETCDDRSPNACAGLSFRSVLQRHPNSMLSSSSSVGGIVNAPRRLDQAHD